MCNDPATVQQLADTVAVSLGASASCDLVSLLCEAAPPPPDLVFGQWMVEMWPLGGDVVFDVGPGLCAYR